MTISSIHVLSMVMRFVSSNSSHHFLCVELGDYVVISDEAKANSNVSYENCWFAQIISVIGGARNPLEKSLFQVIDIDTGIVKTINADKVIAILGTN